MTHPHRQGRRTSALPKVAAVLAVVAGLGLVAMGLLGAGQQQAPAPDTEVLYFAPGGEAIYASRDGGRNWERRP